MNKKEFMELSSLIIGGLGIHGILEHTANAEAPENGNATDDFYLMKGLTGMARAKGWFDTHWGASVLAGYYLCRENSLGEEVTTAIRKQLDAMIRLRASQFDQLPAGPANQALIEEVPKALYPALRGGLRAHGHAAIFAALSTQALRNAPQMAQPALIKDLCGLSRQIAKKPPKSGHSNVPYTDTQAMVEATFDSILRFKEVLGHPSVRRPNFTHMITHTDALMTLESLGYRELARAGYAGHKVHIDEPVPDSDPASQPRTEYHATLEDVMSTRYWENGENLSQWNRAWNESSNPNGYWVAFGHLFKVLYSYHRLVKRVKDPEKVRLCSMILLERYLNPNVQGG